MNYQYHIEDGQLSYDLPLLYIDAPYVECINVERSFPSTKEAHDFLRQVARGY